MSTIAAIILITAVTIFGLTLVPYWMGMTVGLVKKYFCAGYRFAQSKRPS